MEQFIGKLIDRIIPGTRKKSSLPNEIPPLPFPKKSKISTEKLDVSETVQFSVSTIKRTGEKTEAIMNLSSLFVSAVKEHRKNHPNAEIITPATILGDISNLDNQGNINYLSETLTLESVKDSLQGVGEFNRFSLEHHNQHANVDYRLYYLPVKTTTDNIALIPLTFDGYGEIKGRILGSETSSATRIFVPPEFTEHNEPHRIAGTEKDVLLEKSQGKVVLKGKGGKEKETYTISICTTEGTRDLNEDAVQVHKFKLPSGEEALIASVKDGMGGHSSGEVASEVACRASSDYLQSLERNSTNWTNLQNKAKKIQQRYLANQPPTNIPFEQALGQALAQQVVEIENTAIYDYNQKNKIDSGATRTGVIIIGDKAYISNIGDSRTSTISPDGQHLKTTEDHSLVQAYLNMGRITPEQAVDHPEGNVILRSLGDKPTIGTEIEGLDRGTAVVSTTQFQLGTTMAITCDGIPDGLKEVHPGEKVAGIIRSKSLHEAASQLVEKAGPHSGDNDSVLLVKRTR
jgi:serine/threonine protein phosphatase PrpC